ncbi:UNVERIFIED_CONTAM: hypothetical protein K2H54_057068 [Gekko kuhli]
MQPCQVSRHSVLRSAEQKIKREPPPLGLPPIQHKRQQGRRHEISPCQIQEAKILFDGCETTNTTYLITPELQKDEVTGKHTEQMRVAIRQVHHMVTFYAFGSCQKGF